jgi:hypothetical protein
LKGFEDDTGKVLVAGILRLAGYLVIGIGWVGESFRSIGVRICSFGWVGGQVVGVSVHRGGHARVCY